MRRICAVCCLVDFFRRPLLYNSRVVVTSCQGCQPWATIVLQLLLLSIFLTSSVSVHSPFLTLVISQNIMARFTSFRNYREINIMYMMHVFSVCWFFVSYLSGRLLTDKNVTYLPSRVYNGWTCSYDYIAANFIIAFTWNPFQLLVTVYTFALWCTQSATSYKAACIVYTQQLILPFYGSTQLIRFKLE